MDPLTTAVTLKALDGLSLRAEVTAQNIANANSRGYRAKRVSFEAALQEAARGEGGAVAALQPKVELDPTPAATADMRLDLQLATASVTAQRYGALIDVLSRQLQLESLAITGNG